MRSGDGIGVRRQATAWTPFLQWAFIGLQLLSVQMIGLILIFVIFLLWVIMDLIVRLLTGQGLGFGDTVILMQALVGSLDATVRILLPLGAAVAVAAWILVLVGTVRRRAWASWAAMGIAIASIPPPILLVTFGLPRLDLQMPWLWVPAVAVSAAWLSFLIAIILAHRRHGPWGMKRQAD